MAANVAAVSTRSAAFLSLPALSLAHVLTHRVRRVPLFRRQLRDAINSGQEFPGMRQRNGMPGELSDDEDDEDPEEVPLVPFEKAIVGFFFAGFFMCVLMLVGLTKVRRRPALCSLPPPVPRSPSRSALAQCLTLLAVRFAPEQLAKLVFLVVSILAIGVAAFADTVPSAPVFPGLKMS